MRPQTMSPAICPSTSDTCLRTASCTATFTPQVSGMASANLSFVSNASNTSAWPTRAMRRLPRPPTTCSLSRKRRRCSCPSSRSCPRSLSPTTSPYAAGVTSTNPNPGISALEPLITELYAVVTVTDDGGSNGRLRGDFKVLPPGDIRNCIAAPLGRGGLAVAPLPAPFSSRF